MTKPHPVALASSVRRRSCPAAVSTANDGQLTEPTRGASNVTPRDRGLSLIEVLVAVVLLGLAGTAVLGAMATSIKGSVVSRTHAAGLVWLQSSSDYLSTTPFIGCTPGSEALVADGYRTQLQGAAAPRSTLSWPQANLTVVEPVMFWSSDGFAPTCNTSGIQQITLQVTGAAGEQTVQLVVVKSRPSS